MIREIRGTVVSVEPEGAVVDVAGWGVFVSMISSEGLVVGQETHMQTHLAFKQDGVELYGFTEAADVRFFQLCLLVSGVGPKTALSILRRAPREALEGAIAKRDISYLTRVVGLGKKAAEKLVVELSEKVGMSSPAHEGEDSDVFDTLVALGYTDREARRALSLVPGDITGKDARLKAALSSATR
ncbi:MAG: Holliday junction branch migration protein RuvA [Patescibacteria group bacterium]